MINQASKEIICTAYGKGKEHDFRLFKRSKIRLKKSTQCWGDKGYQGIKKIHTKSVTPEKRKRGEQLSREEKKRNKDLAKRRVAIENIYRSLKIFKILSERYRKCSNNRIE